MQSEPLVYDEPRYLSKPLSRTLGSIAVLTLYNNNLIHATWPVIVLFNIVLCVYVILIWTRPLIVKSVIYIFITLAVLAITLLLYVHFHVQSVSLIWPLVGILATVPRQDELLSAILAFICTIVAVCLAYSAHTPFATLFGLIGLYMALRARRVSREANAARLLHVRELEVAHAALTTAHTELQEATVHSVRYAALEERARLAREIHDGLGHQLTGLIVQLRALELMIKHDPSLAEAKIHELLQVSQHAMQEVRLAVRDWTDDDEVGLVALKSMVSHMRATTSLHIRFTTDVHATDWPMNVNVALYRVLQECFTNILKHAQANHVEVRVKEADNTIQMTVSDDGVFTAKAHAPGFGWRGIRERCEALGGWCTFTENTPRGLCAYVEIPTHLSNDHMDGAKR